MATRTKDKTKKPTTPKAHMIRSRRRPALRVVGTEMLDFGTRHANLIELTDGNVFILEVWTYAEMDALPPDLRPTEGWILPGIGWMDTRRPTSENERADIRSVASQANQMWRDAD